MILALPRGGVPVAAEVAAALDATLDLSLYVRSGCPRSPNWPWVPSLTVDHPLSFATKTSFSSQASMRLNSKPYVTTNLPKSNGDVSAHIGDRERVDVKGRLAIVIDDGIATGATTRGALRGCRLGVVQLCSLVDALIVCVMLVPPRFFWAFEGWFLGLLLSEWDLGPEAQSKLFDE